MFQNFVVDHLMTEKNCIKNLARPGFEPASQSPKVELMTPTPKRLRQIVSYFTGL